MLRVRRRRGPTSPSYSATVHGFTSEEQRTETQRAALAFACGVADELLDADAVVIASPLHKFGVPQHLKTWIDVVITDPRLGPGTGPLAGRPVTLVIARGGGYGAGTPREGWDHATRT